VATKAETKKPMKSGNAQMKRLMEIENLLQPVESMHDLLHSLIWGRVKSGKTKFIASGPNPVLFAAEDGTRTIRKYPNVTVFPVREGGLYKPPRWKDARDFIWMLAHTERDFGTVGVDTVTALSRIAIRFVTKDEELRDDLRAKGTMDFRIWNRVTRLMTEFMEDLEGVCKDRGMHLVYTCQERRLKEEESEYEGDWVPDLSPAIRGAILEKPDIIARTVIEEEESEDLTKTTLKYGMVFKHHEWPVGIREPSGKKPMPAKVTGDITIPKLIRRLR
jgi:hypothetical protein